MEFERKTVFDFKDYKAYLKHQIEVAGRGEKSRIASALKCNIAYVSQILHGHAHLSLEQSEALNEYFQLGEDESDFFLLLVMIGRAGSAALEKRLKKKLNDTLKARSQIENRIRDIKYLPEESQSIYYSTWLYSAIYVLLSIPKFQTRDQIRSRLNISTQHINQILDFLVQSGLAIREGERFKLGTVGIHLKNDSIWTPRNHANWRQQCIASIERHQPNDFHYTSVASFSEKDLPEARKILVDAVEKIYSLVRASPEEELFCYNLDFFKVT